MEGLTQEQIEYLRNFLVELHEKVPHSGVENNEHFLDDVVNKGRGQYVFYVRERKYQSYNGEISVSFGRVLVDIGYESLFLSGEKFGEELHEIAEKAEVHVYESLVNHGTVSEPNGLGIVNIPLFREDDSRLTVDEFVTDYLFKVSQAANLARELEERIVPELKNLR